MGKRGFVREEAVRSLRVGAASVAAWGGWGGLGGGGSCHLCRRGWRSV